MYMEFRKMVITLYAKQKIYFLYQNVSQPQTENNPNVHEQGNRLQKVLCLYRGYTTTQ